MPSIKLTDQVGVDAEVELNENSAIAKYMKDLSELKLSMLKCDALRDILLDEEPLKSLETGITFEHPIGLGVDDTELTIGAGVSGGLKLLSARDKQTSGVLALGLANLCYCIYEWLVKVTRSDRDYDFGHASAALYYCDYFATDQGLSHLITNELKYDQKYDVTVVSKPTDLLRRTKQI